jgi:hypothetical protein
MASGSIISGAIASGQVGNNHIASGGVLSGNIASGQIGVNHLVSGSVVSGTIASGQIGRFHHASGSVTSGHIGNNAVVSGSIASGQINPFSTNFMGEAAVQTTDATVTTLVTIPLADNTNYFIRAYITARRTDSAGRAAYIREVCVYREAAGGATLEGAVNTPLTRESNTSYDATISVSANNALVRVTGVVGHTINWYVRYEISQQA